METTKRGLLCGLLALGTGGCLGSQSAGRPSSGASESETASFDITDISIQNNRETAVVVTISATSDGESVFSQRVTIPAGETRQFDDPLADDTEYTVIAEVGDGSRHTFDWQSERRDNRGVRIVVGETVTFDPIVA